MSTDQIPVHVGINMYEAGYLTHNQDDGTYLVLRPCFEVWNGYDEQCLSLDVDSADNPAGVTIDVGDECPGYDEAEKRFLDERPEFEAISGMNDSDEAGYVVGVKPEATIIVPLPGVDFLRVLETQERMKDNPVPNAGTGQDLLMITDKMHGWKDSFSKQVCARNPADLRDDLVFEIDLVNNPELAGWGYPDRDQ